MPPNGKKVCTHCKRTSHTVKTCYKKHGYPPDNKFYNGKTSQINNIVVQEETIKEFFSN